MANLRHPSEKKAIQFLKEKGHIILEHNKVFLIENYQRVEIDIITFNPTLNQLHFVEVKSTKRFRFNFEFVKPILKKKEKWFRCYNNFIKELKQKVDSNLYEDNKLICLLKNDPYLRISVSYDIIYINGEEIFYYPQFLFES